MSEFAFDASTVKPSTGERVAVPKGLYKVLISASEIKPAKSGQGRVFTPTFRILDGEHNGQTLQESINIIHSNETAQRIGQEQLSAICHCVSVLQISDTAQLHGRPLMIDVDTEAEMKNGEATGKVYNRVLRYLKADGSPVTSTASAPAAGPATAPAWAASTAPAAPVTQPPPQPAPVAPTPPPAAPAPVLYYVSHKGQNITPAPIPAAAVAALGLPPAEILVCENGGTEWKSGTILGVAPTPPPPVAAAVPNAVPPWAQTAK